MRGLANFWDAVYKKLSASNGVSKCRALDRIDLAIFGKICLETKKSGTSVIHGIVCRGHFFLDDT
jgi:hypothetical protein